MNEIVSRFRRKKQAVFRLKVFTSWLEEAEENKVGRRQMKLAELNRKRALVRNSFCAMKTVSERNFKMTRPEELARRRLLLNTMRAIEDGFKLRR